VILVTDQRKNSGLIAVSSFLSLIGSLSSAKMKNTGQGKNASIYAH
jgi:hypothetical protein